MTRTWISLKISASSVTFSATEVMAFSRSLLICSAITSCSVCCAENLCAGRHHARGQGSPQAGGAEVDGAEIEEEGGLPAGTGEFAAGDCVCTRRRVLARTQRRVCAMRASGRA
eukprot:4378432-Pleurochrysis_carterae.AAC.1